MASFPGMVPMMRRISLSLPFVERFLIESHPADAEAEAGVFSFPRFFLFFSESPASYLETDTPPQLRESRSGPREGLFFLLSRHF